MPGSCHLFQHGAAKISAGPESTQEQSLSPVSCSDWSMIRLLYFEISEAPKSPPHCRVPVSTGHEAGHAFHNRKIICQSEEKAWSSSACRTWPAGAGCRSPAAGSPRRSAWIVLAGVVHWPPPEPPACRIAESWKRAAFGCPVWPGRPSPQQLRSRFRRRRRSLLPRLPLGHRRRSGVAAGDVVTVCQIWWSFWSVCWHQFFPKPKQLQYCKLFYHLVSIHNYNILLITLLLWLIETCTAFWSCKYVLFL